MKQFKIDVSALITLIKKKILEEIPKFDITPFILKIEEEKLSLINQIEITKTETKRQIQSNSDKIKNIIEKEKLSLTKQQENIEALIVETSSELLNIFSIKLLAEIERLSSEIEKLKRGK